MFPIPELERHAQTCTGREPSDSSNTPVGLCPLCERMFPIPELERHAQTCTGRQPSDSSNTPVGPCPLCERMFPIPELERHAQTCTGKESSDSSNDSAASCPLCGRVFSISCLEQHASRCTGVPETLSVSLEGESTVRAGQTFSVIIRGEQREMVECSQPVFTEEMMVLSSTEIEEDENHMFFKRTSLRSTATGFQAIVVIRSDTQTEINGSPLFMTVTAGLVNLGNTECKPAQGDIPVSSHICLIHSTIDYVFVPRDEFGNVVPCTSELASKLKIECSNHLMIMDTVVHAEKIDLLFRPLEEGEASANLLFDGAPVLPHPITILTVTPDVTEALASRLIDGNPVECSIMSFRPDRVGAEEIDGEGDHGFISVTPSRVTVFLDNEEIVMCWPLKQALSMDVESIPEQIRLSVFDQQAYLNVSEVGVGRMRLRMPKIGALMIAISTKETLNKRYVGGSLEGRKELLNDRIVRMKPRSRINLEINREDIISEAWNAFSSLSGGALLSDTKIVFNGEPGIDCGGLSREFLSTLQRDLFSPDSGLWAPATRAIKLRSSSETASPPAAAAAAAAAAEDGNGEEGRRREDELFAPLLPRADPSDALSRRTGVGLIDLYRLCGIVVARTLAGCAGEDGGAQLPYRLASSVFKHVLSLQVNHRDLERDDPSFYTSTVRYILDNPVEYLDLTFCEDLVTQDNQPVKTICLDPESPQYYALHEGEIPSVDPESVKPVTDENKVVFLDERAKYRLRGAMQLYLDAFREGFLRAFKEEDAALLNPDELVLVTCASAKIDVEDMKNNAQITNYKGKVVSWLWQAVETFCETERRMFLLFMTGSICPPQGGFARMDPQLTIRCLNGHHHMLPRAHTCFNLLELPEYVSYDELFSKLLVAINEGCEYNGIE